MVVRELGRRAEGSVESYGRGSGFGRMKLGEWWWEWGMNGDLDDRS